MHILHLTYGIKDGVLKHVDDVPNGLECGCICPHCKATLNAKNGGIKNIHHFAHASGTECAGARMTALHLLAQEILQEDCTIMLPDYESEFDGENMHIGELRRFKQIRLEQTLYDAGGTYYRADCVAEPLNEGGQPLAIEIKVTHKVGKEKTQYFKDNSKYCIEVDLSPLLAVEYTKDGIRKFLLETRQHRQWLSCPVWDTIEYKLKRRRCAQMTSVKAASVVINESDLWKPQTIGQRKTYSDEVAETKRINVAYRREHGKNINP